MIELPPFADGEARRLRDEAHGMARAYGNTLLAELTRPAVVGIWAKGSAFRPWDSLIDYVPELSDVDVHVRLAKGSSIPAWTLSEAVDVAERARSKFRALFPRALHLPRPQVRFEHLLRALPEYVPAPEGSLHTLHGEAGEVGWRGRYSGTERQEARRFLQDADAVPGELALQALDRPGHYCWKTVRSISWRLGSAGPRLLTQLGVHPFDAWSLNRTSVVQELALRGYVLLAEDYAKFYLAGWEGFRSGFSEGGAAIRALGSAERFFRRGRMLISSRP